MDKLKKKEIQKQVEFLFKEFEFNDHGKEIIENAHKLLKAYEFNKDISFYDIDQDFENKIVKITIKSIGDKDFFYLIEE